jgi:hypothetical protein
MRLVVLLGLAGLAGHAHSQAQAPADRLAELERKLEASLEVIQQLSGRLRQVESQSGKSAADAAAVSAPALAAKVADLESQVKAAVDRPEEDRGLALHGFADVGLARSSLGRPSGGYVGSLDFYMTPKMSDRVVSLIELNFEVSEAGDVGVDLERLQVGYIVSDNFTLWAGRFHSPYGYWNTAFHHGAQLQTSLLRPRFLDFEDRGGILPAHSVGLWGTGSIRTDAGRLGYDLYTANSSVIAMDDPATPGTGVLNMRQAGATDRGLMVGGNLSFGFKGALDGLTLGLHALQGSIKDDLESGHHRTHLGMLGAWGVYNENNWDVMGEYYHFSNRDQGAGTGTHGSSAWYLQAGYSVGAFTPFARIERTRLDQTDNYFAQQASGQSYERSALGVRYELNPRTALKLEASHTRELDRAPASYTEFRSQLAVRF